jgi:hypothetical protein
MMTEKQIEEFEKCESQLHGLHEEIGLLSKKNPDDRVNNWKLKYANRVIAAANKLMGDRYRPFGGFEGFEAIGRPTNSDVVMMLAQYIKCMDQMRADNVYVNLGRWYWVVDGERSKLLTAGAKKLKT